MIELKAREWTHRTGTGKIAIIDLQDQVDKSLTKESLLHQTVLIDRMPLYVDGIEWGGGTPVLGLIVRPIPSSPASSPLSAIPYQKPRQPLIDLVDDCLDLLDQLVDPLLEVGVMKSRVQTWKKMMRDLMEDYRKDGSGE